MLDLNMNYKTNDKTLMCDFHKEIMRRVEIVKLINSYKKSLIQTYVHNSAPKLPKLNPSNSHYDITFKKMEKSNFLSNNRNKTNFFDKKNNINYRNLNNINQINQIKNKTFRNKIKIPKKIERNFYQNNKMNINYFNSFNLMTYKTNSYLNKESNTNSNNRIRIYKIKNLDNSKNVVDEFSKVNNEYCFLKKNYNVRKNNINMDIFNLLNTNNNNIFCHTVSKLTKNIK